MLSNIKKHFTASFSLSDVYIQGKPCVNISHISLFIFQAADTCCNMRLLELNNNWFYKYKTFFKLKCSTIRREKISYQTLICNCSLLFYPVGFYIQPGNVLLLFTTWIYKYSLTRSYKSATKHEYKTNRQCTSWQHTVVWSPRVNQHKGQWI